MRRRSARQLASPVRLLSLLAAVAALAAAPPAARAEPDRVEAGRRATVFITVESAEGRSTGTGFCIDAAGLFITNDHVVTMKGKAAGGRPPKITVVVAPNTKAERRVPATVVRTDPGPDVALLRVATPGTLDTIELAPPAAVARLRETDPVMALGYPFGAKLSATGGAPDVTVSTGKITSLRRADGDVAGIQFDGSINPGNSGGPLLDRSGLVVGVVFAIIVDARQINLAVPVTAVWDLLADANVVLTPPQLRDPQALAKFADGLLAPPVAGRVPVPDAAALKAAQGLARELFASRYADRSAKARQALAYDVLDRGLATADDPAGRYALLSEARELAIGAVDVRLAYTATMNLWSGYEVARLDLLTDLVNRLGPRATKPQDAAMVATLGLGAVEATVRRDAYADARKLIPLVRAAAAASRNPVAMATVRDRLQRAESLAAEYDRGRAALAKLAADPADADANLAAGRYHCFVRGEYGKGLALLAKGKDASLKAIAAAELAVPTTTDAQKAVADLWWDQANRETASRAAAERCKERAASWYRIAEPGLTGLARASVQERLAALPPPPPPPPPQPPAADAVPTASALTGNTGGKPFEDVAPPRGILVGLVLHASANGWAVNRLQPVYATAGGDAARGTVWGKNNGREHVLVARDGYAVGGLIAKADNRVHGLAVVFMRRVGDRLDPNDQYVSEWVGGDAAGEKKLLTNGDPVVGVCGRGGDYIDAVGLVIARPPKR